MANNDDRDDLSREMRVQGIPDLQQNLRNAGIDEMNNAVGIMLEEEDVVNDDMSDMTGQDKDFARGKETMEVQLLSQLVNAPFVWSTLLQVQVPILLHVAETRKLGLSKRRALDSL